MRFWRIDVLCTQYRKAYEKKNAIEVTFFSIYLVRMSSAHPVDKGAGFVIALLVVGSISLFLGIDYTYSAYAQTQIPNRISRMHLRGFLYLLLTCLGILLMTVIYLLATRDTRSACRTYSIQIDSNIQDLNANSVSTKLPSTAVTKMTTIAPTAKLTTDSVTD